ncbi:MAG: lipid-A-disaccharide synthase [Bacteroidales bacterium]
MRYYIIAGEASGDMHAANLMEQIKRRDAKADFRFWGGDRMVEQGGQLVKHYKHHAFMGFAEVIVNIRTILKNLACCKKDLKAYNPDIVILVDYPGFNLRIAEFVKKQGIKVAYYISPQIWAWKESRIHKIKKYVDQMFVILPFEKAFYQKHQMEVSYVGHPLLDELQKRRHDMDEADFRTANELDHRPVVALLPGSRKQEIRRMLPVMLKAASKHPSYQYVIAGTPDTDVEIYHSMMDGYDVHLLINKTYALLQIASAAMVTSGTASLETALFHVPQLVMYKTSAISYRIARMLVHINYISIANLVFQKEIFKEFIQADCHSDAVAEELDRLMNDTHYRNAMLEYYALLDEKLGGGGASEKVARQLIPTAAPIA